MSDIPVYTDGSEVTIVTEEEEPPASGEWVDQEEFIHNPTDDEVAMGDALGKVIDINDDVDNGSAFVVGIEEATQ